MRSHMSMDVASVVLHSVFCITEMTLAVVFGGCENTFSPHVSASNILFFSAVFHVAYSAAWTVSVLKSEWKNVQGIQVAYLILITGWLTYAIYVYSFSPCLAPKYFGIGYLTTLILDFLICGGLALGGFQFLYMDRHRFDRVASSSSASSSEPGAISRRDSVASAEVDANTAASLALTV